MVDSPDHAYASEDSATTYFQCYIPPDIDESNAESVAREEEIQKRIQTRKHKNASESSNTPPTQRQRVHETQHIEQRKQLVQTITLDDLNPHGLYPNPDKPLTPQDITVLYDSGASITMLPGAFKTSWRNLRPSMMSLSGAFDEIGLQNIQVGEFHAQMTLDNGETVRVVIPEAVSLPDNTTTYLLCDTQFLLAGHEYLSDLRAPKLKMANGEGTYTMDIIAAHKIIKLLPISAYETTNHRTILLHLPTPYEPPTFYNNVTLRRPDITTPTALVWHARLGCACKEVMMRTQKNVQGMRIQNDSWKLLDTQLPCSSCVAGKMRKSNAAKASDYTDLKALTTTILASQNPARHFGFAVSRTPATTAQSNERNKLVSVDWAIIHKENIPGEYNVFALFHDANIGLVHVEFQPSRGQAGEALEGYIQRWGIPHTIHHDNAQEFLHGKFATVCRENKINQTQSAPYSPNQNPAERYMEIIVSGARSLLYTSGLPVSIFWSHAVSHRAYIQNMLALLTWEMQSL
jgi:hypothetical protein